MIHPNAQFPKSQNPPVRMSHMKADKRVFLYQQIQLKVKVEDAGFKPEFVEWDDVDTSADEAIELPQLA